MKFPDFNEFRSTFTEEKFVEMFGSGINQHYVISDIRDPENFNAFIGELATQTISKAATFNLRMLEAYHEWLSKQF